MRAVAVRAFRTIPELMDVPEPKPGPGEILVRLSAASVNPYDWKLMDGIVEQGVPHVFPLVLGVDGAGIVERVAPGANRFSVGDRVYGQFKHPPIGVGTYAEYVTAPDTLGLSRVPKDLDLVDSAAIPTAGMTALHAVDTLDLSSGRTLLIVGAPGGVGSFATQIAASRGIRVLAMTRAESAAYVLGLGAAETIDRDKGAAVEQIRESHPKGVDALLDLASGGAAFAAYATLIREGGSAASTVGAADLSVLRERRVRGANIDLQPSSRLLDRLAGEVSAKRIKIPVESRAPLSDAPAVVARNRAGGTRGKSIILI